MNKIKTNEWHWNKATDYPPSNGVRVFSCFACGGGSSMGYKFAGCDVIGINEIDESLVKVYKQNFELADESIYTCDIRLLLEKARNKELSKELYDLDILDASPPCSTFSNAGLREKSWGVERTFREGQVKQRLDDLPFVTCELIGELKPKVAIIENVEGLIRGSAKTLYFQKIVEMLHNYGYKLLAKVLHAEDMGVPQRRHRVFIIAFREDLSDYLNELTLNYNYEPIVYSEIKTTDTRPIKSDCVFAKLLQKAKKGDKSIADVRKRIGEKANGFQEYLVWDEDIMPTLRAKPDVFEMPSMRVIGSKTFANAQTFPQDYDFTGTTKSLKDFIIGMSVPPLMVKRIAQSIIDTGVFKKKVLKRA